MTIGNLITLISSIALAGACVFLYRTFCLWKRERDNAEDMEEDEYEQRHFIPSEYRDVEIRPARHTRSEPERYAAPHVQASEPANRPPVPASRENITETGPMIYFANDRHERDDKEYRFNYKKVGGSWRAYILRTPSFGDRNTASGVIHRLRDESGDYICWDRDVNSLKDMQVISRRWADSIQEYISTGNFV